jgi:hypothetical protein
MLTANRPLYVFLLLLASWAAQAQVQQAQPTDTVARRPFERYWTRPRIVPKLGVGVQESAFLEVGLALHRIYVHPLTLASAGPYLTVDAVIVDNNFIVGPKLGYGLSVGLLGFAADMTYYTDLEKKSLVVTPKAGISLLGFADLFYGHNFYLSNEEFSAISVNRFSLVFTLNRDYFDLHDAHRRRGK